MRTASPIHTASPIRFDLGQSKYSQRRLTRRFALPEEFADANGIANSHGVADANGIANSNGVADANGISNSHGVADAIRSRTIKIIAKTAHQEVRPPGRESSSKC